jgi:hypothetical protein
VLGSELYILYPSSKAATPYLYSGQLVESCSDTPPPSVLFVPLFPGHQFNKQLRSLSAFTFSGLQPRHTPPGLSPQEAPLLSLVQRGRLAGDTPYAVWNEFLRWHSCIPWATLSLSWKHFIWAEALPFQHALIYLNNRCLACDWRGRLTECTRKSMADCWWLWWWRLYNSGWYFWAHNVY